LTFIITLAIDFSIWYSEAGCSLTCSRVKLASVDCGVWDVLWNQRCVVFDLYYLC